MFSGFLKSSQSNPIYSNQITPSQTKLPHAKATIFRMCIDAIITPEKNVLVLETGSFLSSSFTGFDRNRQPKTLTKRQEAMRDLASFAKSLNLPLFIVGDADLLGEGRCRAATELAGMFWENDTAQENFFSVGRIEELKEHIKQLPVKQFDPCALATYRCIIVSVAHLKSGFTAAFDALQPNDELESLRELEDILFIDQ